MRMPIQLVIDCADPDLLCAFWAAALHYEVQQPPDGHPTWASYWIAHGLPPEDLENGIVDDRLADPDGTGPQIWFQQVPEPKTVKNRLHLDLGAGGGRDVPLDQRRVRVDAEVDRLRALGGRVLRVLSTDGLDHYGVVMADPEGNEFCVH